MTARSKWDLMIALVVVLVGAMLGDTLVNASAANSTVNITMSTILEEMFATYDRKLPPRYDKPSGDRQVKAVVNIFILSMYSISEMDMEYSLSMFLRQRWSDERLRYQDVLNLTRIELAPSMYDDIWKPDLFIPTEKYSDFHEVTVRNQMVHIYPDGTIQYSARVTGQFFCNMDLRKYPFDTQHCTLELESYAYDTEKLTFTWSDPPIAYGDFEFPQFELEEIKTYRCDKTYFGITYPCIGANFVLKRNYSYYIVQIYVPSILIVILSWVNFWLDCTCVPGRVSLALLTVLTMTTQSSGARANLPRVSYIKAIDVWMAACLTFVFLGLLEFAYVNVQSRVLTRRKSVFIRDNSLPLSNLNGSRKSDNNDEDDTESKCEIPCFKHLRGLDRARAIDKVSRVLFPVSFMLFNLIYWLYYFHFAPESKKHTFA